MAKKKQKTKTDDHCRTLLMLKNETCWSGLIKPTDLVIDFG